MVPKIKQVNVWWLVLFDSAESTGLEPATSSVTGRRSNQLSYDSKRGYGTSSLVACPSAGVGS